MKLVIGNTYSRFIDVTQEDKDILAEIDAVLSVKHKNYYFDKRYKSGRWDGKEHFYDKKNHTFPTGLIPFIEDILEDYEIEREYEDKMFKIDVPDEIVLAHEELGQITLRDYQHEAVKRSLELKRGIVNVATNGGKTEIASGIIQQLLPKLTKGQKILFVTHNTEIFQQSANRIEERLGIEVGRIAGSTWNERVVNVVMIPTLVSRLKAINGIEITYTGEMKAVKYVMDLFDSGRPESKKEVQDVIAMLQDINGEDEQNAASLLYGVMSSKDSLKKQFIKMEKALDKFEKKKRKAITDKFDKAKDLIDSAVCFIGDEYHHSSSDTWYKILMSCENAEFRIGLTGTVDDRDAVTHMRTLACTGDILIKISNDFLIKNGYSARPTILLETIDEPVFKTKSWQEAYRVGITENKQRNEKIIKRVVEKYKDGKGCLLIVSQTAHGELLQEMLQAEGVHCDFTHGKRSDEDRERILQELRNESLKVLIATPILDEGVDVAGLNCVFMVAGGKSFRQILQRVGRGLRVKKDGSGLEVYDYLDYTNEYLTKHTQERFKYYKNEKFEIKKTKD
ncbi:DEAD/DEAH box helicase [Bacillus paranthracis]|uniref:DEAD/DEAH box helicase n=1 Tax=Bacillus paranthracis TaxID=2026186 RepID=UPI0022E37864|nr:helicase-related protein [Bacillus paranthracis]